jgi:hypothetical protein
MSELDQLREVIRLGEEVRELNARLNLCLNNAVQDSASRDFPDKRCVELLVEFEAKVELYREVVAQAYPPQRERTAEELELLEFANRLAERQGTFMSDFDALAKRKAELDHRLLDP